MGFDDAREPFSTPDRPPRSVRPVRSPRAETDDIGSNGSGNEPFAAILNRRISRRALLRAVTVGAPLIALSTSPLGSQLLGSAPFTNQAQAALSSVGIASIPNDLEDRINIAEGYAVDVLIRWGDPVTTDAPVFALELQTARGAGEQFGFNCDLNAFFPLYPGATDRGLLAVNHEYTTGGDMFLDYDPASPTEDQVLVQVANHGMSIIEVAQNRLGPWQYRRISRFNRRITGTTPMRLTGPAAGHELMQTSTDPTGRHVLGMFNNCAGGKTPWGTVLTCEENFHGYFGFNDEIEDELAKSRNARYGVSRGDGRYKWERFIDRFDLRKEPNEVHRHGYVVEIDPFDPTSTPRKHTAMGRFKHEAANTALADDGRIVVYSGDDERFDYIYKFITRERFDPYDRAANLSLLESGTLFVARFDDSGSGEWIPLVPEGPLAGWTQAEISIFTRLAADAVGATPMDRPEDVEVNPVNKRVYVALTNNTRRSEAQVDGPNPRGPNTHGHILELTENGGDSGSTRFTWDIFILCGDPAVDEHNTYFAGFDRAQLDAISAPDNVAFDGNGNLWITTDGQPRTLGAADAVYVVPTAGPERGRIRRFMTGVPGGEMAGPEFTPDFRALFVSIQHPGEGGGLAEPTSTFPDGHFPRPSVVVARKLDGGQIGT